MKKRILFLSTVIAAAILACESRAYIVFEHTSHDFGKVKTGITVSHTFKFKNAGTDTLVIDRIKAG